MAGSFVALPITVPHLRSEASVVWGLGWQGTEIRLLSLQRSHAAFRRHRQGVQKHILSPVPLHSNILLQTLAPRFGPEKAAAEE